MDADHTDMRIADGYVRMDRRWASILTRYLEERSDWMTTEEICLVLQAILDGNLSDAIEAMDTVPDHVTRDSVISELGSTGQGEFRRLMRALAHHPWIETLNGLSCITQDDLDHLPNFGGGRQHYLAKVLDLIGVQLGSHAIARESWHPISYSFIPRDLLPSLSLERVDRAASSYYQRIEVGYTLQPRDFVHLKAVGLNTIGDLIRRTWGEIKTALGSEYAPELTEGIGYLLQSLNLSVRPG